MKKNTAFLAATAIATLTLAGQAFAIGGSMGGGSGRGGMGGGFGQGSMSGNTPMTSTMSRGNVGGMTQGAMPAAGGQQGAMAGSGPKSMKQGTTGKGTSHQNGTGNGKGATVTKSAAASTK